jgi:hypothetical protein
MKHLASGLLLSILYTGVCFSGNAVSYFTDALDTQLISLNLECEGEHDENKNLFFHFGNQFEFIKSTSISIVSKRGNNNYLSLAFPVYIPPPEA